MKYPEDYFAFESKIQSIFKKSISALNEALDGSWQIRLNNQYRRASIETDIEIYRGDQLYSIVEIKVSTSLYERAVNQTMRASYALHSPFFFVVTPGKFGFYYENGEQIEIKDKLITSNNIKCLLSKGIDNEFSPDTWERLVDELIEDVKNIQDENFNSAAIHEALEQIKKSAKPQTPNIITIDDKEDILFDALLGNYPNTQVCRFTSLSSIFRTVNDKAHSMCSIVCMNDKSETSYVQDYLSQNSYATSSLLNDPTDWNNSYIVSCCDISREDDFTMMRLYGDDAKGVVIKYDIDTDLLKNDFRLRPVSYQRKNGTHPELIILGKLLSIDVNGYRLQLKDLNIWKHFFKPREYEFEKEVRLLYRCTRNEGATMPFRQIWILNDEYNIITPIATFTIDVNHNTFPLILNEITLGPKMRESDINEMQLKHLCTANGIKSSTTSISVKRSAIQHYR